MRQGIASVVQGARGAAALLVCALGLQAAAAQPAPQPAAIGPAAGIAEVLQFSQLQRLAQRPAPEGDAAALQRVHDSFQRLLAMRPQDGPAELVLVGGPLYVEALFGRRAVAVSESVGQLPEGERLLLLAHELGHLSLQHWGRLSGLYRSFIPGPVRPETTEPVAAALGAQAHALSHQQEFEADAYGYRLVRQLGFGVDTAFGLLTRQGVQMDGATHPGTRRRVTQLRVLASELDHQQAGGDGAALAAVLPAR
jgi:Zn-dependent protease with chaperone function